MLESIMNNTPYWIMLPSREKDSDAYISGIAEELIINSIRLDTGKYVNYSLINTYLNLGDTPYERIIDVLESGGANGIALNKKTKGIFEKLELNNIQYFDTKVIDKKKEISLDEWYLANIIGLVDCIDYENSELVLSDDKSRIEFIDSLSFHNQKIIDSKLEIFRLDNFSPIIITSDRVRKEIISNNIIGFEFILPEDFDL